MSGRVVEQSIAGTRRAFLTRPMRKPRSLDQAIARAAAQLPFIPTAGLRQMRIQALINEQTASTYSFTYLLDDLGRALAAGGCFPIVPWRMIKLYEIMTPLNALALLSELHDLLWASPPGQAYTLPDSLLLNSHFYELVCRPLDERYVAICPFAPRADGNQCATIATRDHRSPPFEPRDLRVIDRICGHFSAHLQELSPGPLQPPAPRPAEQVVALDSELRPTALPLYCHALLWIFYGRLPRDPAGRILLPVALVADLRRHQEASLRSFLPAGEEGFHYAFTKAQRGRVLCLSVQSAPGGGYRLTLHEDASKHERLRRLKKICWDELERDRCTVFRAALALLDDVRDPAELARRAGLSAHQPASALRIVNRARSIVAAI